MTADLYSIEAKGGILGLELWFNNPPLWGRRPPLPLGLGCLVVCESELSLKPLFCNNDDVIVKINLLFSAQLEPHLL